MYEWIGKLTAHDRLLRRCSIALNWIPRQLLYLCCSMFGFLLYVSAGRIRLRIESNMNEVLSPLTAGARRRLSLRYFNNLAITLYEILFESYRLDRHKNKRFLVEGELYVREALQQGRGAIVYTPHFGNFFYYYWYLTRTYDCLTIASAGSPELLPMYLKFQAMGCRGLDYDSTPPLELYRTLKKHLAAGGVVFILGDFYRSSFPVSLLFGRKTRTPEGAAMFAIENKAPIIPFYGYRTKGWRHRMVFEEPLYLHERLDRSQRAEANQELNHFMERVIRERPAEWFYWFNADQRWEQREGAFVAERAVERVNQKAVM